MILEVEGEAFAKKYLGIAVAKAIRTLAKY